MHTNSRVVWKSHSLHQKLHWVPSPVIALALHKLV